MGSTLGRFWIETLCVDRVWKRSGIRFGPIQAQSKEEGRKLPMLVDAVLDDMTDEPAHIQDAGLVELSSLLGKLLWGQGQDQFAPALRLFLQRVAHGLWFGGRLRNAGVFGGVRLKDMLAVTLQPLPGVGGEDTGCWGGRIRGPVPFVRR